MTSATTWMREASRVLLLVLVSAAIGYMFNRALLFVALSVLLYLGYWLNQLRRIQYWLASPDSEPPESTGVWGDIFDRIYNIQRRNSETHSQLQLTVDYLRDSFASMRDGVVMLDGSGTIEWNNKAAEVSLGLSYPGDRGQPILNLVRTPEFHRYYLAQHYDAPLLIQTNDDPVRHLQFEITRFGEGDRLLFIRDVTQFIQLEQMRNDFIANISHELRTPLTVVSGYIATLLEDSQTMEPNLEKPLRQMGLQADRMESLLKDLLLLSNLENTRDEERESLVDFGSLLHELQQEIQENFPNRALNFSLECDYQVPGNYKELYSAASNLILNALKYSPQESEVKVSWAEEVQEYLFSVVDQGPGITAEHLPRLTERFYRVDSSRSSVTGGTGLGLAIVKHVAVGHQAELRIESVPGLGSHFSIAFAKP
jgi:two-component system phosphate regulon sensor histidine kinase PhoR